MGRTDLYLDDLALGDRFESRGLTLTEAAIVDFALVYDPQPFHIDAEAASATHFGGLIASGFQTLAVSFRLLYQTEFIVSASLGGPGLDELRWVRPVRPGDTLRVVGEVVELRPSTSKPDRGLLRLGVTTFNQRREAVMTAIFMVIAKRRRE